VVLEAPGSGEKGAEELGQNRAGTRAGARAPKGTKSQEGKAFRRVGNSGALNVIGMRKGRRCDCRSSKRIKVKLRRASISIEEEKGKTVSAL